MSESVHIPVEYTWPVKIASYDVGADCLLSMSSQLKLQQEVGEHHLSSGGLSYQTLCENGIVFVLTRLNSAVYRAPALGENVRLTTWHYDSKGAQFYRCYRFEDEQGKLLIDSVSAFAIVDPRTHKLLRPAVFEKFGVSTQPDKKNTCPDPGKLNLPEALVPAGERIVRWSDLDCNDHLSNTIYTDIAADTMPGGLRGKRITGFSVEYRKEAREGDIMMLSHADLSVSEDRREAFVAGAVDGNMGFAVRVEYVPAGTL